MLIEHTKELAKELGYRAVLIYGDPRYYSKFGFVEAENYDIRTSDNMYAVPLQALELYQGALSDCGGCFLEDAVFEIDETAIYAIMVSIDRHFRGNWPYLAEH